MDGNNRPNFDDPIRLAKEEVRKKMRAVLKKITPAMVLERSEALAGHLLAHPLFAAPSELVTVGIFYPLPSEPSLLAQLAHPGVRWVFPRIEGERMSFYQPHEPERADSWSAHRWGVTEPRPEMSSLVAADEMQVLCVPGLAFDRHGHRLGRGAGYYDRWIAHQAPAHMIRIGLGWHEQLCENLPTEPHDARMHHVVTEKGWIEPETAERGPS